MNPLLHPPVLPWDPQALSSSPAFAPLRAAGQALNNLPHWPTLADYNALPPGAAGLLHASTGKPLCFVAQDSAGQTFSDQYEPRIFLAGEIQVRLQNWHDLFNALVWLSFPQAKAAINTRHYAALINAAPGTPRGAERDALTLFDESGVVVVCAQQELALAHLLTGFEWKALFWQQRQRVREHMGFFVFGHGLHEKLLRPFQGLTGKALIVPVENSFMQLPLPAQLRQLDQRLGAILADETRFRATRELTPLPLLGIPGWAVENERADYYDDARYFRPGRRLTGSRN